MKRRTATEAARGFSEVLDAVEHRGEVFMIHRRGRPVAHLRSAGKPNGRAVKALLRGMSPDTDWAREVREMRSLLTLEERSWPD
ncbi:MAG: type II toxin-antitoxin system Phd/YefM family antitoxin [Actinobacteria bacterium]|nr:type II toxin-antitoxin system Phd/YefM family antitoxin [Actinomycetota bacterium]